MSVAALLLNEHQVRLNSINTAKLQTRCNIPAAVLERLLSTAAGADLNAPFHPDASRFMGTGRTVDLRTT